MDERTKKLLGDGPYPFQIDEFVGEPKVDAFICQTMIILASKGNISMPKGSHTHESYEFLIPLSDMPNTAVEKRLTNFEKNKLFPLNSEQSHGPIKEIEGCKLLGFQIDKDTFNDISQSLCKKTNVTFENKSFMIGNEIYGLLDMFMKETRNIQTGSDFIQQNIVNILAADILRQINSNIPKLVLEKNYCERENINRAISYLREEYNNDFSLEDVARIANLSQFHFIRTFKSITGKTPYDYLLDVKIEKSKEFLKLKKYSITDICFMCGFNNLGHFSSVFKKRVGLLPSQYRKL